MDLKKEMATRRVPIRAPGKDAILKLWSDESGNVGVLMQVFMAAIIIAAIVVAFQLVPTIGFNVESATTIPSTSQWNSTTNANIVTGPSLWGSSGGMLRAAVIIGVAALALFALFGLFMRGKGGKDGM